MIESESVNQPCPHCQQSQNNKVLFINGSIGNKKKLVVVYKTATNDLKVEFNTEAEIKYCPVCGRGLSRADNNYTDMTYNDMIIYPAMTYNLNTIADG